MLYMLYGNLLPVSCIHSAQKGGIRIRGEVLKVGAVFTIVYLIQLGYQLLLQCHSYAVLFTLLFDMES